MKMKATGIFPFILLLIFSCSSFNVKEQSAGNHGTELQNIIAELESALSLVSDEIAKKTDLKLESASLQVSAEIVKSIDGKADIWVITGKGGRDDKTYDKISIVLAPAKQKKLTGLSQEKTLSKRLADTIISAIEGISQAGAGKYPLEVEKATIEMGIATSNSVSFDAGIDLEVLPLSLSGAGKYTGSSANVLKIELSRKK